MAKKIAARTAQWPLVASFTFDITDTMVNTSGAEVSFKAAAATLFEVLPLPPNAIVIGGAVVVNTVSNDSGTATIEVGDADDADRYLATPANLKAAGRTALDLTGYKGTGQNLRVGLVNQNGDATAGNVTVYVEYIADGKSNEVCIA